jgi:hypothetical protein
MDGNAICFPIVVIFLSIVEGVPLGLGQLVTVILVGTLGGMGKKTLFSLLIFIFIIIIVG